jgi:predicted nucleic acid-binding protein
MPSPDDTRGGAIVVDASIAAAWCLDDEAGSYPDVVLDVIVQRGARVPSIWSFEMANVLAAAERRGRIDAARVRSFLDALLSLPIDVEERSATELLPALVATARAQGLSAYDAAYLELAFRTGAPMATSDRKLRAAATAMGVSLVAPGGSR